MIDNHDDSPKHGEFWTERADVGPVLNKQFMQMSGECSYDMSVVRILCVRDYHAQVRREGRVTMSERRSYAM